MKRGHLFSGAWAHIRMKNEPNRCLACGELAPDIQAVTLINDPRPGEIWAVIHDRCYSKYGMPSQYSPESWLAENYPAFGAKA